MTTPSAPIGSTRLSWTARLTARSKWKEKFDVSELNEIGHGNTCGKCKWRPSRQDVPTNSGIVKIGSTLKSGSPAGHGRLLFSLRSRRRLCKTQA
jgi:hypothetical protein